MTSLYPKNLYSPQTLTKFENNHMLTKEQLSEDFDGALASITIDGCNDKEEHSSVICVIYLTETKKFIIDWHKHAYHLNPDVQQLIKTSKRQLLEAFENTAPAIHVYCDCDCAFSENKRCTYAAIALESLDNCKSNRTCVDYSD